MTNVDIVFRLTQLGKQLKELTTEVNQVKNGIGMNELWDNTDMIRNWKISERTLATWRHDGLIGFVKVGGKVWYPREQRELFLSKNLVDRGERYEGEEV